MAVLHKNSIHWCGGEQHLRMGRRQGCIESGWCPTGEAVVPHRKFPFHSGSTTGLLNLALKRSTRHTS